MSIFDADPEDLYDEWQFAKEDWHANRARQLAWWKAERRPTEAETLALEQARARFEAAERMWDEAYRAGVVIETDEDPDGTLARLTAAVTADPLADEPRLAYASAVEDSDPERAAVIRMQVEYSRRRAGLGARTSEDNGDLSWRSHEMSTTRGLEWCRSLRNYVDGYGIYRGFPEAVRLDAAAFLRLAPRLFRLAPILQLELYGVAPVAAELFGSPHLQQIRTLSLLRNELGDAEAAVIAASPHLGELRWLDLGLNRIGAAGLEALAASPGLPRLEWLGFSVNAVDDPTPRHADEYDYDSAVARELQDRYGRRAWLSAHPRALWPPDRDCYAANPDIRERP
jgi:uncharacterized protein (TIGR02996 family)